MGRGPGPGSEDLSFEVRVRWRRACHSGATRFRCCSQWRGGGLAFDPKGRRAGEEGGREGTSDVLVQGSFSSASGICFLGKRSARVPALALECALGGGPRRASSRERRPRVP